MYVYKCCAQCKTVVSFNFNENGVSKTSSDLSNDYIHLKQLDETY